MTTVSIAQGTQSYCPECNLWKPEFDPGATVCRDCAPIAVDPAFRDLIQPLADEERTQLEANLVAAGGARDPIVLWGKIILDGHNRFEICGRLGLPYTTVQAGVTDRLSAEAWIIRNQFGRRNLTPYVRGTLALRLEAVLKEQAKGRQKNAGEHGKKGGRGNKKTLVKNSSQGFTDTQPGPDESGELPIANTDSVPQSVERPKTRDTIASTAGVSHDTIAKIKRIEQAAPEALKVALRSGEATIHSAFELTKALKKAPEELRKQALAKIESGKDVAEVARKLPGEIRLKAKRALAEEIRANPVVTPDGRYQVIVIDPPWQYTSRVEDGSHRGKTDYADMSVDELCALPVPKLAQDDCVLWLWTTNAFMAEAYECLNAWGFKAKTILTWDKQLLGLGNWLRNVTEHCILATRGKPVTTITNQTTLISEARREHSRKPEAFYALVNEICPGAKLEMFARCSREGWASWGAESDKFGVA